MTESRAGGGGVHLPLRTAPPSFLTAVFRVARIAPFRVLRGRRLLALLLLVYCPLVVVLLLRIYSAGDALGVGGYVDLSTRLYLTMIFPVTLLFLGAGAIGDDIDNGTLLYLRLRPVAREAIVCGRFIATTLSACVLLAPAVILLFVLQVGWRGAPLLWEQLPVLLAMLGDVALASMAYGALFLLLSLLLRHAVIVGVFFVVGWEVFVSVVIPSKAALLTVSFHLSAILWHVSHEGVVLGRRMARFEEARITPDVTTSVVGLLIASVTLLLIACAVFRSKEYIEQPGNG